MITRNTMNNFLRILLATIIMPAYLIADEADEPTSPAKPDGVEVKENDEEEVENDSEDSEDKTYLIEIKPKCQTQPPNKPKRKTKKYINEVMTKIKNTSKWETPNEY